MSRLFHGGDVRRAEEAEAGGDYVEAARRYAAAGLRAQVAQMQLLQSERTTSPEARLEALRDAARWADEDSADAQAVRGRIAGAMLTFCRARGVITAGDRAIVAEAAALYTSAGDAAGAGACHELIGAAGAAADAYQRAGEVDRLEALLDDEADKRRRTIAVSDALDDHRLRMRSGDAHGALLALELALPAAEPHERGPIERLRDELVARHGDSGVVRLRVDGTLVVVALAPVVLGREAGTALPLRDAGISRRHAQLDRDDARWAVTDLGSKNGTLLSGVAISARMPLPERVELGIGEHCALDVQSGDDHLLATIVRGVDRGTVLHVTAGAPVLVVPRRSEGALRVRFADGRASIAPVASALRLNGASVGQLEPLRGDVIECGDVRWEIVR